MENEVWAPKYQQSVPTSLERTEEHLNNGNTENEGEDGEIKEAGEKEYENFVKSEPDHDPGPISLTISEKAKLTIQTILEQISPLSQVEKFLLFLKLPGEVTNAVDPFRQTLNPLGSRTEIYRTISWIKTHLEEDPDISLPKQEVYNEYHNYCVTNIIKPLSQADFGKVMKQVYPKVRARRLGTRGNSRYCYSGLRRCMKLKQPQLPDLADKPMSTEAPFTQSSLTSAAWLIVKEWSEQQLNHKFDSIQSLAYYLILNHAVGTGSEAALKIASVSEYSLKGEELNCKSGNKHREMQLQLQRKIQQKNEGKDRKRKMQSPKSEPRPSVKKTRSQSVPAPTVSAISPLTTNSGSGMVSGECSTASSSSTSPTQGKIICDKSLDFTQVPALPDFNSFQKPAVDPVVLGSGRQETTVAIVNKVPIPRLHPPRKQFKYKPLRPRLHQCDIASYNPQPVQVTSAEEYRSQELNDIGRIKERNSDDEECDVPDFPLTRERLDSVSNVSKDAMDEYLGTNSQHEEELSKYFSNNNVNETTDPENTSKLSTLRQLLEQNIVDNKSSVTATSQNKMMQESIPFSNASVNQTPVQNEISYITPIIRQGCLPHIPTNTKRRVSFETQVSDDAVPPSPNTRRKDFNFTPISPGPQSPSGTQSKCSSTTASPFVSPRSTPIVRTKTAYQNTGILKNELRKPLKVKREINLTVEIPSESQFVNSSLPMSAPVSPMMDKKSVLHKLLNSNSKVEYSPGYGAPQSVSVQPDTSQEGSQFFASNIESNLEMYRSQSVPLHNMVAPIEEILVPEQTISVNDFPQIEPIPDSESDRILHSLDEQPCDNNNIDLYNVHMNSNNTCLSQFGLQIDNGNQHIGGFSQNEVSFPDVQNEVSFPDVQMARTVRSQSIGDIIMNYQSKSFPSRSVPSTPLPFPQTVEGTLKVNYSNSRSHPSTPRTTVETFTYANNGDCLLNGQPIRTDSVEDLEFMQNFEMNADNNVEMPQDKGFSIDGEFVIENDTQLLGTVLMDQNYNSNID
ncbi:hypothetical protein JTB14_016530 [Gonioctena quinquepunctata]|nr:hypothetical protein JTB14_016530 [Gonioctena quinquepunctata]